MADLKPLGSEKLQGNEKIQRILDLTFYNETKRSNNRTVKPEFVTEGENGVYGIVREKDVYYVKKGLTEDKLDYIGGMFMKNKNKFSSYAEAYKRLDLLKGQETLQEATKYVLKQNKPDPAPAPAPAPIDGLGGGEESPMDDLGGGLGGDEGLGGEEGMDDLGGGEEVGFKGIQKMTGKLGQKLRDFAEEMEVDNIKYVINSILSALDLTELTDEDKEEIFSKFEATDEMGGEDFAMGDEELPDELNGEDADLTEFDSDPSDEASKYDFSELGMDDELGEEGNFFDDNDIPLDREDEELGEESGTKEFSLEELTDIVNNTVKDNLSNYFK